VCQSLHPTIAMYTGGAVAAVAGAAITGTGGGVGAMASSLTNSVSSVGSFSRSSTNERKARVRMEDPDGSRAEVNGVAATKRAASKVVYELMLPTALLAEWADREGRPQPLYVDAKVWEKGMAHQKVILPAANPKEAPREFTTFDDAKTLATAKEQAALAALVAVCSDEQLEFKLPKPYADVWKSSRRRKPSQRPLRGGSQRLDMRDKGVEVRRVKEAAQGPGKFMTSMMVFFGVVPLLPT